MLDWFEKIDFTAADVILVVTIGWKERFLQEAHKRHLPLTVVESPFDFFYATPLKRFTDMYSLIKTYKPSGIVFFQGHFEEFGLPELIPAFWKAKGNIFMHENLGSPQPPQRSSKKYFGFIPGAGLWWEYYMLCIRLRAYVTKNILTVSREIKNRYVSWWGYPADRVLVAYHGVDSKNFSPDPAIKARMRRQLGIPENDKTFISVARFTEVKRLDRVIRAFNSIYQNDKNIHLILVGSGPLENEYRQLAGSLPCSGHIHFTGQVNNPSDYLKIADIFVLSSDNEGLSIALMEAMASGLIAISTDCTGSNEVIKEGETGFIVTKSDEAVSEGMRRALSLSSAEHQAMQQSAIRIIREEFDIDNNVRKILKTMGVNYLNANIDRNHSHL